MRLHDLEEVTTKDEFINHMKVYGTHVVICIFDHYGIRKVNGYTYEIVYHREKHRPNWYNNTEIEERRRTLSTTECFDFVRLENRKHKIRKLKPKIDEKDK